MIKPRRNRESISPRAYRIISLYVGWSAFEAAPLGSGIYDKTVSVVFHKRDRYKRTLGKVLGADAGLDQIEIGMARHYKRYEREQLPQDRAAYTRAEETAPAERRGLWRDQKSVPPWNSRKH